MDKKAKLETDNSNGPELSIVIPVYNEEGAIGNVCESVGQVLDQLPISYEIIVVDDGSVDSTFKVLTDLTSKLSRLRLVRLRRNFGQTAALRAGFDYSRGEIIVSMDGDGQNDAQDIPRLLEKLREGFDVVNGWRKQRKDSFFLRRVPSYLGNRLISLLTGVRLHDFGCTLKAYRREVIEELSLYGEMHRMIPVLTHLMGASITEIEVGHHPRATGRSKYNLLRTFSVILDLITLKFFLGFFTRPLHIFGLVGLVATLVGMACFTMVLVMKFAQSIDMTGNPFLQLGVLCVVVGVQLVMLGLIGEVTIRTYFESQNKPIYVIREIRESSS